MIIHDKEVTPFYVNLMDSKQILLNVYYLDFILFHLLNFIINQFLYFYNFNAYLYILLQNDAIKNHI